MEEAQGEFQGDQDTFLQEDFLEAKGQEIVSVLYSQAAAYHFTKVGPFRIEGSQPTIFKSYDEGLRPEEPQNYIFTFSNRYSSDTFHGIMPDTGARPQFKAPEAVNQRLYLYTLVAGQHTIRFGKGEATSLGKVAVPTPFGNIDFHILPTNTPFLSCLYDMDRLRIRLDNIRNVLIQDETREVPIIRKFGHPFLLLEQTTAANTSKSRFLPYRKPETGRGANFQPQIDFGPLPETLAHCHLSKHKLRRLNRRFGHLLARRLVTLLNRAGYSNIQPS